MNKIHILGTSHIARGSIEDIKEAFLSFKPDIIAVELDKRRLHALLTNQKPNYSPQLIKVIGVKGYVFALVGSIIQQKLGKHIGVVPGADMKQAALLAYNNKIPLLLMDKDIMITLQSLSKSITGREKWRLFIDIFFGWMKKQERIAINLNKVPGDQLITQMLERLKERYPTFYRVLVHERNVHMAQAITHTHQREPEKKILVVVGAGHKKGLEEELKKRLNNNIIK